MTAGLLLLTVGKGMASSTCPDEQQTPQAPNNSALCAVLDPIVFGGWLGGFWSGMNKMEFYPLIALIAGLGGALIWVLRPIVWAAWPDETGQTNAATT